MKQQQTHNTMTLNKDKDGYVEANGFYIQPEEVEQIENNNFTEFAKSQLINKAKENNLNALNSYSTYADKIADFVGLDVNFTEIRNLVAKEFGNFKGKDIGFKLG